MIGHKIKTDISARQVLNKVTTDCHFGAKREICFFLSAGGQQTRRFSDDNVAS